MTWLPAPTIDNVVMVSILLADRQTLRPGELGYEAVIGSLPLQGGGVVWVVAVKRPMVPDERTGILRVRDQEFGIGALKGPTSIRRGQNWGSITWNTTSPTGPPMLVQIAIGPHNFEAPLIES